MTRTGENRITMSPLSATTSIIWTQTELKPRLRCERPATTRLTQGSDYSLERMRKITKNTSKDSACAGLRFEPRGYRMPFGTANYRSLITSSF